MACPWFYPIKRLGPADSILPLGDGWAGECRAPGCEAAAPGRAELLANCNLGYARAACNRVPADGPDAVRWAVSRDDGATIGLCCIIERDYLPAARADLEYDAAAARFTTAHPDAVVAQQARAYVESYLTRKQRT